MTTINHEAYVSLEVAKLLKEAGFDWEVYTYYTHIIIEDLNMDETTGLMFGGKYNYNSSDDYSAPTLYVAQRWLREVKDWEAQVAYGFNENGHKTYVTECGNPKGDLENYIVYFSTYEEALEAGIKKALEIILEEEK